jgi:hypothetical protein
VLSFINEENELWKGFPRLRGNAPRTRRTLVNRAKKLSKMGTHQQLGNKMVIWKIYFYHNFKTGTAAA